MTASSSLLENILQLSLYSAIWRASVASETLTGVTQLKIGDVCLFIGERDTYRGNTIENRGCLFIGERA